MQVPGHRQNWRCPGGQGHSHCAAWCGFWRVNGSRRTFCHGTSKYDPSLLLNIKISDIIHQYYYPNIIQHIIVEPQNARRNIFQLKRIVPIKSIYKTPVKLCRTARPISGRSWWNCYLAAWCFSPPDGDGRESHPSPFVCLFLQFWKQFCFRVASLSSQKSLKCAHFAWAFIHQKTPLDLLLCGSS